MSDSEKDMMTIEAKFRVMEPEARECHPQNFFSFWPCYAACRTLVPQLGFYQGPPCSRKVKSLDCQGIPTPKFLIQYVQQD